MTVSRDSVAACISSESGDSKPPSIVPKTVDCGEIPSETDEEIARCNCCSIHCFSSSLGGAQSGWSSMRSGSRFQCSSTDGSRSVMYRDKCCRVVIGNALKSPVAKNKWSSRRTPSTISRRKLTMRSSPWILERYSMPSRTTTARRFSQRKASILRRMFSNVGSVERTSPFCDSHELDAIGILWSTLSASIS